MKMDEQWERWTPCAIKMKHVPGGRRDDTCDHGNPYLHDAANKNVHDSNASRTTHPETHLETQNTGTTHLETQDTATPQHKTTTQGHAACLCINSYKSAEQMACV